MDFGETRRAIRLARLVMKRERHRMNMSGQFADFSLSAEEWDATDWYMGHLKVWLPQFDDKTGALIPEREQRIRMNMRFVRPGESRAHFMFKGAAAFRQEEHLA